MNPVALHFVSSYLLMPLLTIIFGVVAYFIARKNKLLNNKRLIVYLLLSGIVLALPGLAGFMNYSFMPYMYILLVVVYWIAGYCLGLPFEQILGPDHFPTCQPDPGELDLHPYDLGFLSQLP